MNTPESHWPSSLGFVGSTNIGARFGACSGACSCSHSRSRDFTFAAVTAAAIIAAVCAFALTPASASVDGTWGILQPASVAAHTVILDPFRDRVIVYGGVADVTRDGVFEISLGASPQWREISTTGTPPPSHAFHTAIHDPLRDRMVVFGSATTSDVRVLSLGESAAWSLLTTTGTPPSARTRQSAIYDPIRDRMIVFGGSSSGVYLDEVWELSFASGAVWSQLLPAGSLPDARDKHCAIYDPIRDRMLVFAGHDAAGVERNDLWALDLDGTLAWTELSPAGTLPNPREFFTMQYDAAMDRAVVFAGRDDSGFYSDVWELALGGVPTWSDLSPIGAAPKPRCAHAAVIDPEGGRLVLFGGVDDAFYFNDAWTLSLSGAAAWSEIPPALAPSLQSAADLPSCFDSLRERMIVFVGAGAPSAI